MSYNNILITGGSGFIGTNLLKRLSENKKLNIKSTYFNKKPQFLSPNIEYIQTDLSNKSLIGDVYKDIDIVLMAAAVSSGANIMANNPLIHLNDNILMNTLALEESYKNNVKQFIFISSNTVYPLTNYPVVESDASYDFFSSYHIVAWMKRFTEIMCDMYSNKISKKMKTLILRPGNLYGPHDKFDWAKSKVIPALIRKVIESEKEIEVWGDGKDIKDFLYIDDFIELLVKLIYDEKKETNLYNVASGTPITIKQILDLIIQILGKNNLTINYDTTKPTMIPIRKINIDKVQKETNWYPKVSMKEGLKNTISWYKNAYKENKPEELN